MPCYQEYNILNRIICNKSVIVIFSVCWSSDAKERPPFLEIIQHLEEIRDSSFIGTQQDEFMTLQNDWRIEIEEMFNELKEKEQVCSSIENISSPCRFGGGGQL